MNMYKYVGRDKFGQIIEGRIEAQTSTSVATKLGAIEVTPISIINCSVNQSFQDWFKENVKFNKPKLDALIIFSQQMHTLLKAGISIVHALNVVRETSKSDSLRHVLTDIVISLESGLNLSKALDKHPGVFSPLIISMIYVGEGIGQLDNTFLQIKIYLENEYAAKKRIKSTLRYPFFVIVALIIGASVINLMVIPSFRDFFNAFDSQLPLPTRILIAVSDVVVKDGWLILIIISLLIGGFFYYIRSKKGQRWWSKTKLKLPIIGNLIQRILYARFCRTFAMSISANIPFLEALQLVAGTMQNKYLAEKIAAIAHRIESGETLYAASKESQIFSPLVLQMLAVGEETGNIENILIEVALFYENEVDYDLKRLSDNVEPIIIALVAGMVLLLALAVFLPMWDISTVALKKMEGM